MIVINSSSRTFQTSLLKFKVCLVFQISLMSTIQGLSQNQVTAAQEATKVTSIAF